MNKRSSESETCITYRRALLHIYILLYFVDGHIFELAPAMGNLILYFLMSFVQQVCILMLNVPFMEQYGFNDA